MGASKRFFGDPAAELERALKEQGVDELYTRIVARGERQRMQPVVAERARVIAAVEANNLAVKAFLEAMADDLRPPSPWALGPACARGDAITLPWSAYSGSEIEPRQAKTGDPISGYRSMVRNERRKTRWQADLPARPTGTTTYDLNGAQGRNRTTDTGIFSPRLISLAN